MEETVSGNTIPLLPETNYEFIPSFEPETNTTSSSDNTTYLKYYTDLYDLLESIHEETVKKNEILDHISESLDSVKEGISIESQTDQIVLLTDTEPEETEETEENETHQETVIELLEGIDKTLTVMSETGESINNTVSGNSVYLEGTDNTVSDLLEAYTEVSEQQSQTETYGLSLGIGILFISSCIVGLLIARAALGKMR